MLNFLGMIVLLYEYTRMPGTEVMLNDIFSSTGTEGERKKESEHEGAHAGMPKCGEMLTTDESRWRLYRCSLCYS